MKELFEFFTTFFKIGILTFGGGYAMLPMLEREIVQHRKWATRDDLLDYFAISQCVPGIIAINTATLVGYSRRGFWGALFATVGVVSPSIIIITIIAAVLSNFTDYPPVMHAFAGIRAAVAALIFSAVIKLFKDNVMKKAKDGEASGMEMAVRRNAVPLVLCVLAFVCVAIFGASPVYVVVGAAVAGLLFYGKEGIA